MTERPTQQITRDEIMPFAAAWMTQRLSHNKENKKKRQIYHMIALICGT